MKANRLYTAFGVVLLAVVAFDLLRPEPEPTPFEKGYGMDFEGEEWHAYSGNRYHNRYFSSSEPFEIVLARIDHEMGTRSKRDLVDFRSWSAKEGRLFISTDAPGQPGRRYSSGAKTYLFTREEIRPNLFQRAALAVGLRL